MPVRQDQPHHRQCSLLYRAILAFLLICIAVAPVFQLRLVSHIDHGLWTDLYAPWFGAKAALHGEDPYSPAVTSQIQSVIYSHVLKPGESWDRQAFVYPAYLIFLLGPFTFLPWPVVHFLFAVLAPLAVAATVWVWMRICRPRFSRVTTVIAFVLILTSWPAVWGYYQRQPSLYVIAAIALIVLLFRRRSDSFAGILLALATVKPQLVVLMVAWLLPLATAQRRWRFITAFMVTLALLVAGSLVLIPGWIPHWIAVSIAYSHLKPSLLVFVLGHRLGTVVTVLFLVALGLRLRRIGSVSPEVPDLTLALSLLLATTVCLIPANPWLLFNDLLLIPAIFVLAGQRPQNSFAGVLRSFAGLAIALGLLATPACAALGVRLGYSLNLVMPPFFLNYLVPIPVTVALFFVSPMAVTQAQRVIAAAAPEPADAPYL